MQGYLTRRLVHSIIIILGISIVVFSLSRLSGDPVSLMVGFDTPKEDRDALRKELGLDRPLFVQYFIFLKDAAKGDFGKSIRYEEPAIKLVIERLPATLKLLSLTFTWALLVAIPVGIFSAIKRNSFFDLIGMAVTFIGQSIPSFWLGIMMIMLIGVRFRLLPISGYGGGDLSHLMMPALTLGAFAMASFARITRSSMLEVLDMEFAREDLEASAEIFSPLADADEGARIRRRMHREAEIPREVRQRAREILLLPRGIDVAQD